ncbi:PH domain-containing protein [Halobacterium salinarum]|uniref:PH domain-containing protein n=1 Tax=Halobacterium salinarum TaxID=2242 RepID=UPI002554E16E|nr:PH domain-containing protein [Halobacterium salinarum]
MGQPAVRRVSLSFPGVTDYALYRKIGVVSRRASQAPLSTVQNNLYSQSLTGSLFGYGAVASEIAGNGGFAYRTITDSPAVRALVAEGTEAADSPTGESTERRSSPGCLE